MESAALDKAEAPAPIVTMGLCGEFCTLRDAHPGWHIWSVGYHGDDGGIYEEPVSGNDQEYKAVFGPGQTVGCGVDYDAGQYVFTLDGEIISTFHHEPFAFPRSAVLTFATYLTVARKPEDPGLICRKLYPCVGHEGGPIRVGANFGQSPFLWTGAAELDQAGLEEVQGSTETLGLV